MGDYLIPGHVYVDGSTVTGPNLTEHVEEAILKPTAISSQTLKDPAALSDEVLINDGGTLKKVTWQQVYALMVQPGTVIQTVYADYTANSNLTTVIPNDDTIPQNTEGTEIISASITPRFSTSTILIRFNGQWSGSATGLWGTAAVFRDSVVNAIASQFTWNSAANASEVWSLSFMDPPSTVSAVTYKVRVGPSSGTIRVNGISTTRLGGDSSRAALTLQEIKV